MGQTKFGVSNSYNMKKEFTFSYLHIPSFEELEENHKKTIEAARLAEKNAYAPYSKFTVGAALLLEDGTTIQGNNQENKAYPSGLCAERVALFCYGAQSNKSPIIAIGVTGGGDMLKEGENFSPCGSCRQVMAEYDGLQENSFSIILENKDGSFYIYESIHHLLPFVFGNK